MSSRSLKISFSAIAFIALSFYGCKAKVKTSAGGSNSTTSATSATSGTTDSATITTTTTSGTDSTGTGISLVGAQLDGIPGQTSTTTISVDGTLDESYAPYTFEVLSTDLGPIVSSATNVSGTGGAHIDPTTGLLSYAVPSSSPKPATYQVTVGLKDKDGQIVAQEVYTINVEGDVVDPNDPTFAISSLGNHRIFVNETASHSISTVPVSFGGTYQLNCQLVSSTVPGASVTITSSGNNCVVRYQNPTTAGNYSIRVRLSDGVTGYSTEKQIPVEVVQRTCKKLSLWRNAKLYKHINAYQSSKTPIEYYDYRSASAHPSLPQARLDRSHFFMYQKTGSDDVYLMFTHNYENDNYSPLQEFKTSVDSVANDHKDRFILLDDQNDTHEMTRLAKNSSGAAETTYRMNFKLARNTDGGIIGPFSENRFAVRVWNTQLTVDHRKGTYFYSNDGQAPVKMNDPTEQFAVRYVWEPCSQ